MDTKPSPSFWWLKSSSAQPQEAVASDNIAVNPKSDVDISSSLAEFLEKEKTIERESYTDVDIASIIEEINRVAAQSPLGPYEKEANERSVEEIMREAERIFHESSKSFEQLSARSKTSQNITDLNSKSSKNSTPTPKSVSPLHLDGQRDQSGKDSDTEDSYSDDFSNASKAESNVQLDEIFTNKAEIQNNPLPLLNFGIESDKIKDTRSVVEVNNSEKVTSVKDSLGKLCDNETFEVPQSERRLSLPSKEDIFQKEETIRILELDNATLRMDIQSIQVELKESNMLLEKAKQAWNSKTLQSPEIDLELERTLEELKDTKELNTALQLQLDDLNKSHKMLKSSYEELLTSNRNLDRRVTEVDTILSKYKTELMNVQMAKDKLLENERNLSNMLEVEKQHVKSFKTQNEKDARCILDLNRQIKEMERIIQRKHPDSVSALIVAAKSDPTDSNMTARKILEDRIKTLESEASTREAQSSKIFLEVQEKFNQIKIRYERHIEDLELHVADLKNQLKRKIDTYDVYTQTFFDDQKIPEKETSNRGVQTDLNKQPQKMTATKRVEKIVDTREETHLLATIRGLQTDLTNKERSLTKLQKELEDLKTTNKRLQKEREGSLKNLSDRRHFSSYPEKLALQVKSNGSTGDLSDKADDELRAIRSERDKMKLQLCRIEGDYQSLKAKRLQDLSALQEAHEREIATYLSNITPLREQLEVQQVSLATLQNQLSAAKEELAIVTVERDHLNNRLNSLESLKLCDVGSNGNVLDSDEVTQLKRKIIHMEKRYEEREQRLRAIVHGLAQKNVTNRSCEQCSVRQQQLIGYKVELDQLLATVRSLQ